MHSINTAYTTQNEFWKSVDTLHTSWLAIIITYLSDELLFFFEPNAIFLFCVILPLKTIIFSGFYGAFIDIIKGDTPYVTKKTFLKNVKQFWWIYLLIGQILPGMFFIVSLLTNNSLTSYYSSFMAHFKIFITLLLAYILISIKSPANPNSSKTSMLRSSHLAHIFLLYVASLFIYYLPRMITNPDMWLINTASFASVYLEYLIFIFLSRVILKITSATPQNINNQKELIIINPETSGLLYSMIYMIKGICPAAIGILYALTPKDYKITVFNNVMFKKQFYKGNCLVAITCYTPNSYKAYKIAKEFRARGAKVIMGGPHISSLPNEALAFCDSIVIGEVESVWLDIIKDYESNTLKTKYIATPVQNWSETWHESMLNIPVEFMRNSIETTRGCPFRCNFCTSPNLVGTSIRKMPIPEIIALIKKIRPQHRSIYFNDANIFSNPQYAKELFRALIPLKIRWTSHVTLNIAKDDEALDLAAQSGCAFLAIGLETSDPDTAKSLGGKFRMLKKYKEFMKKIKDRNINVVALFIIGFEKDNFLSIIKILYFSIRLLPYSRTLSHLTPFPGTELYYDLLQNNRLINQNWKKYDLMHFVFKNNFWRFNKKPAASY